MATEKYTTRLVLKNVRFSYLKVFKPAEDLEGRLKYSTAILIPKDHPQINEIKSAIADVINKNAGKSAKGSHNPLRDGDNPEDTNYGRPGYAGHYFLNASTSEAYPPRCVDGALKPANPQDWNSGDYGNVSLRFFWFDVKTKRGCGVALGNIQFVRKGEPLGGGSVSPEKEFGVEVVEPDDEF